MERITLLFSLFFASVFCYLGYTLLKIVQDLLRISS